MQEMQKEGTPDVRFKAKRPNNFWAPFIAWWRRHHDATGRRANTAEIREWYQRYAHIYWREDEMPDISDVMTHAKGMRTTQQIQEFFRAYRLSRKYKEFATGKTKADIGIRGNPLMAGSIMQGCPSTRIGRPQSQPGSSALPSYVPHVAAPGVALPHTSISGHGALGHSAGGSVLHGNNNAMAAGNAMDFASTAVQQFQIHDQIAALMLACGGSAAAANMPIISLHTELRLLAALRHWRQALEAAEVRLQGQIARPQPGQSGGGSSEGGSQLGTDYADMSMAEGNPPSNAPGNQEGMQGQQTASSGPAVEASFVSPCGSSGGGLGAAASDLSTGPAQLLLGMTEDMQRTGLPELARQLLKPLLAHGVFLGDEQLRNLGNIMAQLGMKMDLPSMLEAMAMGADSSGRQAAQVLEAMIPDHMELR